jgi:uncharacterized protein (DUF2062 family)
MMSKLQAWFKSHSLKLLSIRDTPQAIAGGVAIGMFFGFTPLLGLKTLLSLFVSWLLGCNLVAAAVAVTLHDLALPFMPLLYRWEYDLGFWLLSNPHRLPPPLTHTHLHGHEWRSWTTFLTVGKPLLVGSLIFSTPIAGIFYWITCGIITRHRRKHSPTEINPPADSNHSAPT